MIKTDLNYLNSIIPLKHYCVSKSNNDCADVQQHFPIYFMQIKRL
jgi:hypothetical protein